MKTEEKEYFQFYDGDKMGIKTIEDGVIIPAVYDFIEPYSDGLFQVKDGNSHAYFNSDGKLVLPFQNKYDSYGNFTEGLARVRLKDNWGYINKKGEETIKPQFHFAEEFSDGLAIVRNTEDKYGAIDRKGNLVIDYQFLYLSKFENGYAKFGDFQTYGLIDPHGTIVVPQKYLSIGSLEDGKVKVQIKEDERFKEGVLTIEGDVEWNNNLDHVNEFIQKRTEFAQLAKRFIAKMYEDGCPCEYQRFRNYVIGDHPSSFLDQEVLFEEFKNYLEQEENQLFKCTSCGTKYKATWTEYSIALSVLKVRIFTKGRVTEQGAKVSKKIPTSLGFNGDYKSKVKNRYIQSSNEAVFNYLSERGNTSQPWWKNFS